MKILAHRGWWREPQERNTAEAFSRAFDNGFGVETDLRDDRGKVVIAHDMPRGDEMIFEEFLDLMEGKDLTLALNIKADGLEGEIHRILQERGHTNYFVFDMSLPDQLRYHRAGLRVFTGLSDIAPTPNLLEASEGIWLDSFSSEWFEHTLPLELIRSGKSVCIVSAELHGRSRLPQWRKLRALSEFEQFLLCTDAPDEAAAFF